MTSLVSTNPGKNYEQIGSVEITSEDSIRNIVKTAQTNKQSWKETPLSKRISYFQKLIEVYKTRSEEVAKLISSEMGKPISESRADVEFDLENIAAKINLAPKYLTPTVLDETATSKNILYYEPHGVVVVIVPWNYPTSNFFISCLQVMLAGNVVVFKHSEETPLVGKIIEELMKEAGFPEGVFAEVYGDGKVGDFLTSQDIDAIHFTGSSKVGQYLYEKAAKKFIPATLEMGGSSPGVIFADADLEQACESACHERFNNCGQICCALKRLIVHEDIVDKVISIMKNRVEAMKVGDPLKEDTQVGPLVAKRQLDLLIEQVDDAKSKGATIVTGGNVVEGLSGAYYQPTIITNTTPDMRVVSEEVFGPVLPIITFKSAEEAIKIANDTIYGLSAYVYGKDVGKMREVASKIDAGQISINGVSYFSENSPFGGYKMSGIGRNDGSLGFYEATQKKVIAEPK